MGEEFAAGIPSATWIPDLRAVSSKDDRGKSRNISMPKAFHQERPGLSSPGSSSIYDNIRRGVEELELRPSLRFNFRHLDPPLFFLCSRPFRYPGYRSAQGLLL